MKRPLFFAACVFICGIGAGVYASPVLFLSGMAVLLICGAALLLYYRQSRYLWLCVIFIAVLLSGSWRGRDAAGRLHSIQQIVKDGQTVTVQGRLVKKVPDGNRITCELTDCCIGLSRENEALTCRRLILYLEERQLNSMNLQPGKIIVATGRAAMFSSARNYGNFDAKEYYSSLGIPLAVRVQKLEKSIGAEDVFLSRLSGLKLCYANVLRKYLGDDSGIVSAMILGDKTELDEEIRQLYSVAGIAHILAVSGLHVSLLGAGLYRLLRRCRFSFWAAGIVSGVVMSGYWELTGESVSTSRAVLMFGLFVLAQGLGRTTDLLTSCGASAMIILADNPLAIMSPAFVLSYTAVVGIGMFQELIGRGSYQLEPKHSNPEYADLKSADSKSRIWINLEYVFIKIKKLAAGMKMSIFMTVFTAPVILYYYFQIPLYSALLNIIVIPLMGPLVLSALAGGGMGILFPGIIFIKLCFIPCSVILKLYRYLCEISLSFPHSTLILGRPDGLQMVFYYGCLSGLLYMQYRNCRGITRSGVLKRYFWTGCLLAGMFVSMSFTPGRSLEMHVLDVGQGDGIHIHTKNGFELFVDGGSSDVKEVGKRRILPYLKARGVSQIDYWFISHADCDHYSGLQELLELGYSVENLVISEYTYRDPGFEEALRMAKESGVNIVLLHEGMALDFETVRVHCIWPAHFERKKQVGDSVLLQERSDRNQFSLGLLFCEADERQRQGMVGIFCGDLSSEAEKELIKNPVLSDLVEKRDFSKIFYKCNHHGSDGSSGSEWLELLHPGYTVISCGEKNRYGHPGKDAISRLKISGSEIYNTAESGEVIIRSEDVKMYVECHIEKNNCK